MATPEDRLEMGVGGPRDQSDELDDAALGFVWIGGVAIVLI